jgi:glycosyltransferase involved in cell wall biosynthesis
VNEREPILLFEEHADADLGHHPIWVAQVAEAFAADGHDVRVLTRNGWRFDAGDGVTGATATYRMPFRHRLASRMSHEFGRNAKRVLGPGWSRPLAYVADVGRQAAIAAAIRHCLRRFDERDRTITLVLSAVAPIEFTLLAPRRARWILYHHHTPSGRDRAVHGRLLPRLAERRERRRARAGGFVRVVVNNEGARARWRLSLPWSSCPVVPGAVAEAPDPLPHPEARSRMGLEVEGTVALLFGIAHKGKDLDTAFRAFAGPDAPARLVVAGSGCGERFEAFRQANPELTFPCVTVIDGYASQEQRHLLHCAADYAVLSFTPGWTADSGTLGDAVAHALPVCCSATGDLADLVPRHGLGLLYTTGDAEGLRDAARRIVGFRADDDGRAAYLEAFSARTLSRRLLAVAA